MLTEDKANFQTNNKIKLTKLYFILFLQKCSVILFAYAYLTSPFLQNNLQASALGLQYCEAFPVLLLQHAVLGNS